ncbi:MAG: hypothetical protein NT120_02360 [Candidatus Aenigmarchaeota archaeon]|nr:hypothetical protein [Candidatus Aenigmarchaeota archaeon]
MDTLGLIASLIMILVVLIILYPMLPGQDLQAAMHGNLTESRPIIEPIAGSACVKLARSSGSMNTYEISVTPQIKITPPIPQNILTVINFKDTYVRADVLPPDQDTYNPILQATLYSTVPPRRLVSTLAPFVIGQESFYTAARGRDKIFIAKMMDVSERSDSIANLNINTLEPKKTCKANFIFECKNGKKSSDYLSACTA